mgnify:CR=1 FL=1
MVAVVLGSTVLYISILDAECLQLLVVSEQKKNLPQQLSQTITIRNTYSDSE